MTTPTFLGIGVPRGGSTWLHALLDSHPKIYVPTRRKEVRYFDMYYDRGVDWYASFFPSKDEASEYQAIGEVSPQYYKCAPCAKRIHALVPQAKLLITLRHPVDRAYSVYGFHMQRRNFRGSFEYFLSCRPEILQQGLYAFHLQQYVTLFGRTQILPLVFERAVVELEETHRQIASFLAVDLSDFPPKAGGGKVNATTVPRHRGPYKMAVAVGHQLNAWGLDRIVDTVRSWKIERLLAIGEPLPRLDQDVKTRLSEQFLPDIAQLEQMFGLDLDLWRTNSQSMTTPTAHRVEQTSPRTTQP